MVMQVCQLPPDFIRRVVHALLHALQREPLVLLHLQLLVKFLP